MANLRILRKDLIRLADGYSASPSLVPSMGADIGQMDDRQVTRTTSTASQDINYTWASSQTMNMVAVARHNWSDSATLRVRRYSDVALTSLIDDSTALDAFNSGLLPSPFDIADDRFRGVKLTAFYLANATNVKGLKLTIADSNNPDGYMQHARVLAGQYFETTYNPPYGGAALRFGTASGVRRVDGGGRSGDQRGTWRELALGLKWVPAADYDDLAAITLFHDKVRSTFVSLYPGAASSLELMNQMWCGIDDMGPFDPQCFGMHGFPIVMGEM